MSRDPYEVLGVPRNASTAQIRAAYVGRAREAHPDLVGTRGLDVMRALNEAWEILKEPGRRQAWDAAHRPPPAPDAPRASTTTEDGVVRPFWTGAMGPAPGRPWGSVLHFGIYDGWSLGEIARHDRGYLIWLRDKPDARALQPEILQLLNPNGDEETGSRGRRR